MNAPGNSSSDDAIRETAARWTVRRDRGLSAAESIEYELWLAADPRHAEAMQRAAGAWARLDRIPEKVARETLAAARRRGRWWRTAGAIGSLAAAAAVALVFRAFWPAPTTMAPVASAPIALHAAGPRLVTLADGTEVRLNTGGEIVEQFTGAERGVMLARGEAHFTVTTDAARPFVVSAGALRVRAIGTAFNVNLQAARTEVLVTEGRVALATADDGGQTAEVSLPRRRLGEGGRSEVSFPRRLVSPKPTGEGGRSEDGGQTSEVGGQRSETVGHFAASESLPGLIAELGVGERAVVTMPATAESSGSIAPTVVVTWVGAAEITRALAWQDGLLRLGGATLAEIAAEFERRTGHRVVLADPALASLRLGGRFRADDAEGFANLVAKMLEVEVERTADGALVLRKKK